MISVLITAYNAEPYIREAIGSVLSQTEKDIECVVVDDGSTDGTLRAARSLEDPRLRVIEGGRIGRGRALNLALAESRGEYVAILDADDLSHPRRLEIERRALEAAPGFAVVGTGQILTGEGEAPDWPEAGGEDGPLPLREVSRDLVFINPLSHPTLLLRRAALEKVGGYDEARKDLFDWDLLIRLAAEGFGLGKLPVPLGAKRIHPGQFFEGRRQLSYMIHCLQVQGQAVRALGRSPLLWITFPFIFLYRMLPRGLRMPARRGVGAVLRGAARPGAGREGG